MKISAVLLLLCVTTVSLNGISASRMIFNCTVEISPFIPVAICDVKLLAVPPTTYGAVTLLLHHTYATSVCLSYSTTVNADGLSKWGKGACGTERSQGYQSFPAIESKRMGLSTKTLDRWGGVFMDAVSAAPVAPMGNSTARVVPRYTFPTTAPAETQLKYQVAIGSTDKNFQKGVANATVTLQVYIDEETECPTGWYGEPCTSSILLVLETENAFGPIPPSTDKWVYFDFVLAASGKPFLEVTTTVQPIDGMRTSPIVTYVRWQGLPYDSSPSLSSSDYYDLKISPKSKSWSSSGKFQNPVPGRYFIALLSNSPEAPVRGNVSVTVSEPCSKDARYGYKCNSAKLLSPPVNHYSGTTKITSSSSNLVYALFNNSNSIMVSVSSDASKAPPLYLGAGFVPTKDVYTMSINTGDKVNRLSTQTLDGSSVNWFVGIGSVSSSASVPVYLWEGELCARNCSNSHGKYCRGTSADNKTGAVFNPPGTCKCKSDYENFACQDEDDHSFKLEYIILIAVGGAIVLVIIIGVPLYCYVHKKTSRDSRYESLS